MSLVLMWGTGKEIVRVGRIAGQYAKPRSNPTEKSSTGEQIPVFKGDSTSSRLLCSLSLSLRVSLSFSLSLSLCLCPLTYSLYSSLLPSPLCFVVINGYPESEREHRPSRLLDAYFHSAATLNCTCPPTIHHISPSLPLSLCS
eukprot:TRINITY_DN2044_c3_g1_i3.p1 TRINITY_DN2044_c3_g1~~TRINITY_DN2044_c3_g1_i3.p1  ORF type:complete len:143 (+),score=28.10 TRINITY_DN2044_c3_g1_i3:274-702(+)